MRPDGVTLDNWQVGPANRWAFQHVDEVVRTVGVPHGDAPVLDLATGDPWRVPDLDDFLDRTCTDGLLVLHGRDVVLERYLNGLTPSTRHLLMSVSKSLCGAVVGRYVGSGDVEVDAHVAQYVPELADSAYGDATVQQVLDMTVAVQYDETYDDPASEVQTHDRVGGWRSPRPEDPAGDCEFLTTLRRSGEHGRTFAYCSANTDVLAWILERVTGRRYTDILSTDLWGRIGAESDAYVTVDRSGFPMANAGACVTLRDLARFGRVVLDGGVGPTGDPVIPPEWVADIRRGGARTDSEADLRAVHPNGSYRNQFWVSGDERGSFYGVGIHGQYVWMDPTANVVVAKLSSLPVADDPTSWAEHVAFFTALCREYV